MPRSSRVAAGGICGVLLAITSATAADPTTQPADPGPNPAADGTARLVLRVDDPEYFFPFDDIDVATPPFSAYADGRVIYRSGNQLREVRLYPDELDALLAWAADAGGMRAAADYYDAEITHQGVTDFVIDIDDLSRTVGVYAVDVSLDYRAVEETASAEALAGLIALYERLVRQADFVPPGRVVFQYQPTAYRADLIEMELRPMVMESPEPGEDGWPWPELGRDRWEAGWTPGNAFPAHWTLDLTAAEAERVMAEPRVGAEDIEMQGPDGFTWLVTISALLPDEISQQP